MAKITVELEAHEIRALVRARLQDLMTCLVSGRPVFMPDDMSHLFERIYELCSNLPEWQKGYHQPLVERLLDQPFSKDDREKRKSAGY